MPPGLLYFSIRIKINADELGTCECSLLWVWFLEFLDFPARSVEGSKSKWKLIRWQVHLIWSEHTSIWSQLSGIIYRLHIRRCVFVARTPPLEAIKSIVTWLPALSSHRVLVQDGTNCAEDASASGILFLQLLVSFPSIHSIEFTLSDIIESAGKVGSSIVDPSLLPTPQGLLDGSKQLIAGYPFEFVSNSINTICKYLLKVKTWPKVFVFN